MTNERIVRFARWVGALEVDGEFTFTIEQLERFARLISTRPGRAAA
jgi:hypothetical protein